MSLFCCLFIKLWYSFLMSKAHAKYYVQTMDRSRPLYKVEKGIIYYHGSHKWNRCMGNDIAGKDWSNTTMRGIPGIIELTYEDVLLELI
jgi:hypothetical protein